MLLNIVVFIDCYHTLFYNIIHQFAGTEASLPYNIVFKTDVNIVLCFSLIALSVRIKLH